MVEKVANTNIKVQEFSVLLLHLIPSCRQVPIDLMNARSLYITDLHVQAFLRKGVGHNLVSKMLHNAHVGHLQPR